MQKKLLFKDEMTTKTVNMQKTIKLLKKNDELTVIETELDIYLEIPHLA